MFFASFFMLALLAIIIINLFQFATFNLNTFCVDAGWGFPFIVQERSCFPQPKAPGLTSAIDSVALTFNILLAFIILVFFFINNRKIKY